MVELTSESILGRYRHAAEQGRPYSWFNYQPINLPGYEQTLSMNGRNCFDRCERIVEHLDSRFGCRRLKIIDWGSNLGFYCFELAKRGHDVTGIDTNQDHVAICRFLARTNTFPIAPRFYCDKLASDTLSNYSGFDVALCFSVFHHLGKEQAQTLRAFSDTYPAAYIEMDGTNFGHNRLFSFYWEIQQVAETNDPYGSGRRRRKTWFCSNRAEQEEFRNIKQRNLVASRGIFKAERNGTASVIKRELKGKRTHTWIATDLTHEKEMYQRVVGSDFFPRLLSCGENELFRWIELEYIKNDSSATESELRNYYEFLQDKRLFNLDFSTDSFLFSRGKLKVIDLESLFPVETTIEELICRCTQRSSLPFGSYETQLNHLIKRFRV